MIYELMLFSFGIMIGVILDGVYHFKIHIPKETEDKTEKMEKEIEERKKTLELLDEAIEQKKEEKYEMVKQNIKLRKMNEELVELHDTTEKLRKKTIEDDRDMKLYILKKYRMEEDELEEN